jgi:hypothetical protein
MVAALVPNPAIAQDSARISRLEAEIQQLRSQIDEQNRRIQRLEAELGRRSQGSAIAPQPPKRAEPIAAARPAATERQPWHAPQAWDRVAKGMTVEEVKQLLGEPTAVQAMDDIKTLFYRGSTTAGASLSGHVNLRDERVVAVARPNF